MAVVIASIRASSSITIRRLVMKGPPPTMLAIAWATPLPSTIPGAITPSGRARPEGERHEDIDDAMPKQPRVENGLVGVGARIAEFACVADRGLEGVDRPGGNEEAAEEQCPAALLPRAVAGSVPGAEGLKRCIATSPVISGTIPMMSSGRKPPRRR